jgi:FMN phosphatase YigB (HAD superfamily)
MLPGIKAIIFDWGRTLYSSEDKNELPESEAVLRHCASRGYRLALASLVSPLANATLAERTAQIEHSPLRRYFEVALVTDTDKDEVFDQIVEKLGLPREQILIVDDRTIRGIRYGNRHGHPTVWVRQGKFADELPNEETGQPTYTVSSLGEITSLI